MTDRPLPIEPDPGSEHAVKRGCICPVLDNCHGRFPPFRDDNGKPLWWITKGCPQGCPLHVTAERRPPMTDRKPCVHYRLSGYWFKVACGYSFWFEATPDRNAVTCGNCRRTRAWKEATDE